MVANRQQEDRACPARTVGVEDELDLLGYIRVLIKYRWPVLLVCFPAMVVAGTISFLYPPTYVAKASIVPPMEMGAGETGLSSLLGALRGLCCAT